MDKSPSARSGTSDWQDITESLRIKMYWLFSVMMFSFIAMTEVTENAYNAPDTIDATDTSSNAKGL